MHERCAVSVASERSAAGVWRPDIDGLRALAIGAVLLFHFDLLGAEGGFVGVDIFFVISGYLMTSMLSRAAVTKVAFLQFYQRRFWRIAPAYLLTIACTLLAGMLVMLPVDVERLGMSAVAAVLFVPNFFFSSGAGYFDTASIYKPLLHTWSLGVEVQFYLVWPFVMLGITRLRTTWQAGALLLVLAASLGACQVLAITDPKVAFFALPMRIWEFALGALVALDDRGVVKQLTKPWGALLSWLSFAAIVATPWLVREGDLWPAPWALPATLATAMLLLIGGETATARVLGAAPFVFVGRISYSLYLVHWPVVVLASYSQFPQAPLQLRLAALALCFPLAMLLYRYVETPLRKGDSAGRRQAFAAIAGAAVFSVGVGYAAHLKPQSLSLVAAPATSEPPLNAFECAPWSAPGLARVWCKTGDKAAEPSMLLWGDSHGMHFAQGFQDRLALTGRSMVVAVRDACPPVTGVYRVSTAFVKREDCPRDNAAILEAALHAPGVKTVVLAARWAFYAETSRFGAERGGRAFLRTSSDATLSIAATRRLLETRLEDVVAALANAGKDVLIIGQTPELGFDGARCVLMRAHAQRARAGCDTARALVEARQRFAQAMLTRVAAQHSNVRIINPDSVLCDEASCHAELDGRPAYRDDNHLTASAAARVLDAMLGKSF